MSVDYNFKKLEDINHFCGVTDTLVLDFWWYVSWVSKSGWISSLACFARPTVLYFTYIMSVIIDTFVSGIDCSAVTKLSLNKCSHWHYGISSFWTQLFDKVTASWNRSASTLSCHQNLLFYEEPPWITFSVNLHVGFIGLKLQRTNS